MNKTNYNMERTLLGDKVKVVESYELDRYTPRIVGNCQAECEMVVSEIKECCKIYVPKGDYKCLTNFEINYEDLNGASLEEDRQIFQKKLDEAFGKDEYEAFVLGAYIHSGTSFSVNKEGNHVCRFDSSQLGFIGLKKNTEDCYSAEHADKVAEDLTAAWEGEFMEYQVIDNLTDDVETAMVTADYHDATEWCDKAKEKYGVNFDNVEPLY